MAECQIRGGVHQRLPKRDRRREQLASLFHVLQSAAASSSIRLSNTCTGVHEVITPIFLYSSVLSYFWSQTVLTNGTTIIFAYIHMIAIKLKIIFKGWIM